MPKVLQPEDVGEDLCMVENMLSEMGMELEFQVNKNLSVFVKIRHCKLYKLYMLPISNANFKCI